MTAAMRIAGTALGAALCAVLFGCSGGGSGGQSGAAGKDSYASPQEMLADFPAVYRTSTSMGASGLDTESAVSVKDGKATVYVKNRLLGTRWYKWTNETLAALEKAGGAGEDASSARVVYDFDGSKVAYKVTLPMTVGAKQDRIPIERKGEYRLNEADRVTLTGGTGRGKGGEAADKGRGPAGVFRPAAAPSVGGRQTDLDREKEVFPEPPPRPPRPDSKPAG
jgi:hypothetical protein